MKKDQPEPHHNAMLDVGALILWVLLMALFICPLVWHCTAKAAGLTTTTWTAGVGKSYDATPEVDSVLLFYQNYPSADSVFEVVMTQNVIRDTLSFFANIPLTAYHPTYQMNVWAKAWITTLPYPVPVDVHNSGMNIISSDSAFSAGSAVVTLDSAQLAYIAGLLSCGTCAGTDLNPVRLIALDTVNDMRLPSIDLQIFAMDHVTIMGHAITNSLGYFDFGLADGSYLVRAGTPPAYYQQNGADTIVVSGPTQDTVELYALAIMLPTASDSITLVFYLPGEEWQVKVTPMPQAEGTVDTAGRLILPYPQYGNPAPGNFVAQVRVLRSNACEPALPYAVEVYRKSDKRQLVKLNSYTTPDSASAVVGW